MPYNIAMNHLQIILPFGIPPAAMAADLLNELKTPAFSKLIALSLHKGTRKSADFARLLPHESLFAGDLPLSNAANDDPTKLMKQEDRMCSPATTHNKMQEFGLTPTEGFWFTLSPVHIHIARDHLVLTDQRKLKLNDEEANALFEAAKTMCDEVGKTLLYGDAKTWFLRADEWRDLQTATMDAACGHNIDIWMAKGEHGLPWRKLQNEIQMLWFIHDVNSKREARGANLINSVWLHGGSAALTPSPEIFDTSLTLDQAIKLDREQATINLDALLAPALNNDWPGWIDALHSLEKEWFAPLLQALGDKKIRQISLIATDANKVSTFHLTPRRLWNFWTKPSLNKLFSISIDEAAENS